MTPRPRPATPCRHKMPPGRPVPRIAVLSDRQAIAARAAIHGGPQPGFSGTRLIELRGESAGSGVDGLGVDAGRTGGTISGLIVNRFTGNGIVMLRGGNTL